MATNEARNVIATDDRITNTNLLDLVDGGETTLHSHAGGTIASGRRVSLYRSSAQSVNATTWTTIQLDTELYDKLNEFDNVTNYTFTPGVTGYYHICGRVTISLSATTKEAYARIYKNGTTEIMVDYGVRQTTNSSCSLMLIKTVYLLSTDSIVVQVYHNDTGARNVTGTEIETYLTVDRVET